MGFLFHVVGGHKVSVVATQLVIRKLNTSDDFLTPPELVEAMGAFDLDPCASQRQERPIAGSQYRFPEDNGLLLPWHGRVFVNPPFSNCSLGLAASRSTATAFFSCLPVLRFRGFGSYGRRVTRFSSRRGLLSICVQRGNPPPRFFGGAFCAMGRQNPQSLRLIPLRGVLVTNKEIRELKG